MKVYIVETGANNNASWIQLCFTTKALAEKCKLYLESKYDNDRLSHYIMDYDIKDSFDPDYYDTLL